MRSKKLAAQGLKEFVHQIIGIPAKFHTDNAKVETLSEWKDLSLDQSNSDRGVQ